MTGSTEASQNPPKQSTDSVIEKSVVTALRTLVLTHSLPYPTVNGRDLRNWQNIRGLAQRSDVGVFGIIARDGGDKTPSLNLAFWRTPSSSILTALTSGTPQAAWAWPLDPLGHPADASYTAEVAGEIGAILSTFKPQCVVVEGLMLYRYIEVLKRFNCRVVFDNHNVEALLWEQIAPTIQGDGLPERLARKILPVRTKAIEEIAVQSADQVWVCSDEDKRKLAELYPRAKPIHVVPNAIDVENYTAARASRSHATNRTIIFPAIFRHPPNAVASAFLIDKIFPRVSALYSDCKLVLAGDQPTNEMLQAAQRDSRIVVTGAVPDMRPHLAAASVMVVPLFQGSGTRFKILESFASKLPVISTAKGAEGLAVKDETHLLFAESADEFVSAINRLWNDGALARHLAENGLALVNQNYSREVAAQRIELALNALGRCVNSPAAV